MPFHVRAASPEDAPSLQRIERLAGERFRDVGLAEVADDQPASLDELAEYARDHRAWVAVDQADRPVGYLLVDEVDHNAHIEQVSVVPEHQGGGVGRALIDQAGAWAIDHGLHALTLTTFAHVPWNAPLYSHLGFEVMADDEIGPGLAALRAQEAEAGLDPLQRVCMRRALSRPDGGLR